MNTPEFDPKNPTAPFDDAGNMLSYPGWDSTFKPFGNVLKTLKICGMYSGRSAKGVILKDSQGCSYPMFITDLLDLIENSHIHRGNVTENWTVAKRGANYGIKRLK